MSVAAFKSRLPADRALARERSGLEYGIDLDVEMFSEGSATGLEFSVQVKATESAGDRPRVRIDIATLNYWHSLDRPVLLILWAHEEDQIWYCWKHDIDTYRVRPDQKTITVHFSRDRVLDEHAWDLLEAEVAAHRALRTVRMNLPLAVTARASGTMCGVSAGALRMRFEARLRRYGEILAKRASGQPEFRINIRNDTVEIGTAALPSTTIHYPSERERRGTVSHDESRYAADILIGVALQLFRLGLVTEAATIIRDQWKESLVLASDFLANCMLILAEAGFMAEAIEMASIADEGAPPDGFALLPSLSMVSRSPEWNARIGSEIARWAEQKAAEGDHYNASIALVNAGRAARGADPELGIAMFDRAAKLNTQYEHRSYWWRERGQMLFLVGRYLESARSYERAVELGDADCAQLQGDALLHAGDYRTSLPLLLKGDPNRVRRAEFRLKAACIPPLLDVLKIDSQERDAEAALRKWDFFAPDEDKCRQVLAIDALNAPALAWLAQNASPHGLDAMIALCAAVAAPDVPTLWELALATCPVGRPDVYQDALLTARQFCGPALLEHLMESGDYEEAQRLEIEFDALPPEESPATDFYFVNNRTPSFEHIQHEGLQ